MSLRGHYNIIYYYHHHRTYIDRYVSTCIAMGYVDRLGYLSLYYNNRTGRANLSPSSTPYSKTCADISSCSSIQFNGDVFYFFSCFTWTIEYINQFQIFRNISLLFCFFSFLTSYFRRECSIVR